MYCDSTSVSGERWKKRQKFLLRSLSLPPTRYIIAGLSSFSLRTKCNLSKHGVLTGVTCNVFRQRVSGSTGRGSFNGGCSDVIVSFERDKWSREHTFLTERTTPGGTFLPVLETPPRGSSLIFGRECQAPGNLKLFYPQIDHTEE